MTSFLDGKVRLLKGDCLELLPTLEEDSIDSCVTDPPYHLTSIVKRFGKPNSAKCQYGSDGAYARASKGFMGKQWDGGDIAFRPEVWAEVLRVLRPGAHLLAFSGTRTYHRMACAIEDAGFEIRDQIGWCYGSGFPKSHDVSKAIDGTLGRQAKGFKFKGGDLPTNGGSTFRSDHPDYQPYSPKSEASIQWQGWGTALKPAWEPIVLARKPLSESSIAANVLKHGTGGINVDGCRVGIEERISTPMGRRFDRGEGRDAEKFAKWKSNGTAQQVTGRWPANLIHDGSEEVVSGFPDTTSGSWNGHRNEPKTKNVLGRFDLQDESGHVGDSGSAARFFYTAKADQHDRLGSKHPTVKPLDLIQYLSRLITPRNGTILDPFAGTGTLGEAAWREGFAAVLIEREPEYQADIERRMALVLAGPEERIRETIKARGLVEDAGPLFGEMA
jgi:DNA modification methylase